MLTTFEVNLTALPHKKKNIALRLNVNLINKESPIKKNSTSKLHQNSDRKCVNLKKAEGSNDSSHWSEEEFRKEGREFLGENDDSSAVGELSYLLSPI